jgi:hypothetical protein
LYHYFHHLSSVLRRADSEIRQADAAKSHRKQLAKNERRIAELDTLFIKIYEDNAAGKLNDERFKIMAEKYEAEQNGLKARNAALQAEVDAYEADSHNAERFLELACKYTEFDELTPQMLHEFVDKVYVHEKDRSSCECRQQIDIHLNFIGNFTVPGDEPRELTPEEQAAVEERLAKKRKKNENLRAWRAKNGRKKKSETQTESVATLEPAAL